jgi:hypothetical protein
MNEYEVWDINKFVEYDLELRKRFEMNFEVEISKKKFIEFSKGYKFIIVKRKTFESGREGYDLYSVPFFNDKVIGND